MMTVYATAQDILDRYAHVGLMLSGLTEDGEPDTAPLEKALEEAGSEIAMALRGRYALPLAVVPPVLKRIAVDIAMDAPFPATAANTRICSSGERRLRGNS